MTNFQTMKTWTLEIGECHAFITESKNLDSVDEENNPIYEAVVNYDSDGQVEDFIESFDKAMKILSLMVKEATPYTIGVNPFMYNLDDFARVVR